MPAGADTEALREAICGEYEYVIKLLRILDVDTNDLEDVAGEILLDAFNGLKDLENHAKLRAWINTIAQRRVIKYFNKRSNRNEVFNTVTAETGEVDLFDIIEAGAKAEEIMSRTEAKMMVDDLLEMLPAIHRRVLYLRFWGDYKHSEIAAMLGININTEKSIYKRSLERLKKHYLELFGEEDVRVR